ncbi:proline-rich domain-containing protein [Amycolatopsis sp. A133]|uniref:proline-rich domain-containing protein n=1 Tax=Amycolatopsis sp. A133 TaxID=3064472 RepID=UPI0027FAD9DE|nr:proline-rich domain-containing protein [Amycolatopsis sp. A133]MDQ7809238.1 proline-rich domain-containing protein [Amycolatopsis sp. A133]
MTNTGGAPGGDGADTPTPSQGVPQAPAPGSGEPKPPEDHAASQATPPRGWQAPDTQATPPPGWEAPGPPAAPPGRQAPHQPPPFTAQQPQYQPPRWNPHGLGKPGVIALRPLNVGDILDGAITAIRRHALLVLGIGAVVAVISAALTFVMQKYALADLEGFATTVELGPAATEEELRNVVFGTFGDLILVLISSTLVSTFLLTVTTGLMAAVMGRAALGREVTFGIAWREVQPRLLPLLGVAFGYALLSTIGILLCIIPGVLAWAFWALAAPALVLERGTFRQAFSRSVKLVGGGFWRVLGVLLLAWVIQSFFQNIIQLPFTIGTGVFGQMFNPGKVTVPGTGELLLQSAGQIIAGTIAIPFVALVTVIVYLDQRMRREGMDIELARAAGVQPPQAW